MTKEKIKRKIRNNCFKEAFVIVYSFTSTCWVLQEFRSSFLFVFEVHMHFNQFNEDDLFAVCSNCQIVFVFIIIKEMKTNEV